MPIYPPIPSPGWTLGGSILTFAFPMALFIITAAALWVLFTMPDAVPWRAGVSPARSVSSSLVIRDPQPPANRSADGETVAEAGDQ